MVKETIISGYHSMTIHVQFGFKHICSFKENTSIHYLKTKSRVATIHDNWFKGAYIRHKKKKIILLCLTEYQVCLDHIIFSSLLNHVPYMIS